MERGFVLLQVHSFTFPCTVLALLFAVFALLPSPLQDLENLMYRTPWYAETLPSLSRQCGVTTLSVGPPSHLPERSPQGGPHCAAFPLGPHLCGAAAVMATWSPDSQV